MMELRISHSEFRRHVAATEHGTVKRTAAVRAASNINNAPIYTLRPQTQVVYGGSQLEQLVCSEGD